MRGCAAKKSTASSTLIINTSPMLLPLYSTVSVSWLKRRPPQVSQITRTSVRKLLSLRLHRLRDRPPDRIPETDVRGRARARCLADRRLIGFQHATNLLPAANVAASLPCQLRAAASAERRPQVVVQDIACQR